MKIQLFLPRTHGTQSYDRIMRIGSFSVQRFNRIQLSILRIISKNDRFDSRGYDKAFRSAAMDRCNMCSQSARIHSESDTYLKSVKV